VAVDARVAAEFRDLGFELPREGDAVEQRPRPDQPVAEGVGLRAVAVRERLRVVAPAVGPERPVDDRDPVVDVVGAGDGGLEREAVPELRPEFALLGVHGPDQGERRGVFDAHTVALDPVDAAGGGVQEHVDQVVVEQVHLVDVEQPPVCPRQQPGIELRVAVEGVRDRERPHHPLAGRPQREGHERDRPGLDRRVGPLPARLALPVGVVGRTPVRAVRHRALVG